MSNALNTNRESINPTLDRSSSILAESSVPLLNSPTHSPPRYLNHGYNCGSSLYSHQISDSYG